MEDTSYTFAKKERENSDRIRLAGVRRRRNNPVDVHAEHCGDWAKLSIGLPSYVRLCDLETEEEKDLYCHYNDYVQVPFNRIWESFHDRVLHT